MWSNMIDSDFFRKFRAAMMIASVFAFDAGVCAAADVPAVTPQAKPETPLVITSGYGVDGLVLWLAADSGVKMDSDKNVSSLADRTGNFVLTASDVDREPALVSDGLNGRPVLRFAPDQALYSDDEFGTELDHAMTMIVVAKTNAARTFFQYPIYLGQNQTSHANRAICYFEGEVAFDSQWAFFDGPPVVRNAFTIIGVTVDSTVSKASYYRDGAFQMTCGLSDRYGKASFADLSHGVTLGAATDPCRGWMGDIAEVLVFDRQLSAAEMQSLGASLSGKYGLTPKAL